MTRLRLLLASAAVIAIAVPAAGAHSTGVAPCPAATVHYTPYPGGAPGLGRLPWVAGTPAKLGLVALLWYWPQSWRGQHVRSARIYTGGEAPAGSSTKILWAFLSAKAKRAFGGGDLIVKGERLDAPGRTWQHFSGIGYAGQNGAPSFASIVKLPSAGCWRVHLTAGGLKASVVFRAVSG
jgi:hypothetical protein